MIGPKKGRVKVGRRSTLKPAGAVLGGFVKMFEGLLEFFVTGPKLTVADEQHRVNATASTQPEKEAHQADRIFDQDRQ